MISYHEWVHVISLGLQVAAIGHPVVLQDAIIFHCSNIPPFKQLEHSSYVNKLFQSYLAQHSDYFAKKNTQHAFRFSCWLWQQWQETPSDSLWFPEPCKEWLQVLLLYVEDNSTQFCSPVHPFSVCGAVGLPPPSFFSFHLCWEICSCSSWVVHCPYPGSLCSLWRCRKIYIQIIVRQLETISRRNVWTSKFETVSTIKEWIYCTTSCITMHMSCVSSSQVALLQLPVSRKAWKATGCQCNF